MPRIPEPTTDERKELARSLIGQLTMTHQMTMKPASTSLSAPSSAPTSTSTSSQEKLMETKMEICEEYKDHTIKIGSETRMRFRVQGPLINSWFDAFDAATREIDEAIRKHEAQTRKRIAVRVLDEHGRHATVTGIHAGNGDILGLPNKGFSGVTFYPDVPWIAAALSRCETLMSETKEIEKQIKPYRMMRTSIEARNRPHNEIVDALVKLIDDTTKAAEQAASVETA